MAIANRAQIDRRSAAVKQDRTSTTGSELLEVGRLQPEFLSWPPIDPWQDTLGGWWEPQYFLHVSCNLQHTNVKTIWRP